MSSSVFVRKIKVVWLNFKEFCSEGMMMPLFALSLPVRVIALESTSKPVLYNGQEAGKRHYTFYLCIMKFRVTDSGK